MQNTGQEAAVLLQNNDNTLPLTISDLASLALIGPGAGQTKATDGGGEKPVGLVEQREIYLTGFEIAVRDAQPHMIMTSYNQINGSLSAANYQLLQEIARDEWHFGGVFISDLGGEKNADLSVLAGSDLAMPSPRGRAYPGRLAFARRGPGGARRRPAVQQGAMRVRRADLEAPIRGELLYRFGHQARGRSATPSLCSGRVRLRPPGRHGGECWPNGRHSYSCCAESMESLCRFDGTRAARVSSNSAGAASYLHGPG